MTQRYGFELCNSLIIAPLLLFAFSHRRRRWSDMLLQFEENDGHISTELGVRVMLVIKNKMSSMLLRILDWNVSVEEKRANRNGSVCTLRAKHLLSFLPLQVDENAPQQQTSPVIVTAPDDNGSLSAASTTEPTNTNDEASPSNHHQHTLRKLPA